MARFSCLVNTVSETHVRDIWLALGAKAAIGEIQEQNKCIHFYIEVSEEKRQYICKFRSLIAERGVTIRGDINYCGLGNVRAAAAYRSIENGDGAKFYFQRERFNPYVIKQAQKSQLSYESFKSRYYDKSSNELLAEKESSLSSSDHSKNHLACNSILPQDNFVAIQRHNTASYTKQKRVKIP